LANIEKLPDLPQQNQSQPPSTEASHDIPNTDVAKPDSDAAPVPESGSRIDEESAAAASQNDIVANELESAP